MVFLRGKTGGSQPTGGSTQISAVIPKHIEPGDFCVLWVMSSTTTATVVAPSWLTQLNLLESPTACDCIQFVGFVPEGVTSMDVTCDDTTKAWLISASFWGGVDPADPYAFAQFSQSSAAQQSYEATIEAVLANDDFNSLSVYADLDAYVADRGGAWATSGAATDFTKSSSVFYPGVTRATAAQSSPRFAAQPAVGTVASCSVECTTLQILPMTNGYGAIRSGVYARYVDANNYVAAYCEVNSWSYTGGGYGVPYNKISEDVKKVVEVVIGGVSNRFEISAYPLPASWWGSWMAINKIHTLSITRDGVIKYETVNEDDIEISDFTSALGPSGALASGKLGLYDYSSSGSAYDRYYLNFKATGSANNKTCVLVLAGMVPNADTFLIQSTPNNPALIDEQVGDAIGSDIGRALGHRYFFMPNFEDVTVTLYDNLEAVNPDYLTIGSIVLNPADPSPYGQTTRTPSHRSSSSSRTGWKFYLANTRTFEHITLMRAMNRNINWVLNRPGQATFDIRIDSRAARSIETAETCLIAYRDGEVKWSGPIWNIDEDTGPDTVSVTAVGWLQLLEKRLLEILNERYARFGRTDAGIIAAHLISLTNAKDPLPFKILDVVGTQLRKRSYQRYQSIGSEVQALADIESGYDIWIDPATRELVIWNRFEEDLSDVVSFGYKSGMIHNLENVKRTRSADRLVNGLHVIGKTPGSTPPQQIDYDSIAKYGLFEEQVSLSETTDTTVAVAYAAGELVYRSTPLQIFTLFPKQHGGQSSVPRPLDDYHIGSIVKFSANRGSIQVREQKARVFALGLSIDNEGREKVTNLSTTVAS